MRLADIVLYSVYGSRGSRSKFFFFLFQKLFIIAAICYNRSIPCVISFMKMYMTLSSVFYEILWKIISKLLPQELQISIAFIANTRPNTEEMVSNLFLYMYWFTFLCVILFKNYFTLGSQPYVMYMCIHVKVHIKVPSINESKICEILFVKIPLGNPLSDISFL